MPSDLQVWKGCWKIFDNCMLMLGAVDLGVLKEYAERIDEFAGANNVEAKWVAYRDYEMHRSQLLEPSEWSKVRASGST